MSGALDLVSLSTTIQDSVKVFSHEWESTFGSLDVKDSEHDLFALARKELSPPKPLLYATCGGDEDELLEDNLRAVEALRETHEVTYDQSPGGHTWKFWDKALKRVLRWLSL